MKKIILAIIAIVVLAVGILVYKNYSIIKVATTTESVQDIEKEQEKADDELVNQLNELGLNIENLGDAASVAGLDSNSVSGQDAGSDGTGANGTTNETSNGNTSVGSTNLNSGSSKNSSTSNSTTNNPNNNGTNGGKSGQQSGSTSGTATKNNQGSKVTTAPPTQSEVTLKYYNEFITLKSDYESEISNLIQTAKEEFVNLPSEDQTTDKLIAVAFSYMDKAATLEKKADQNCDKMLTAFSKELKANGYGTEIVSQVKDYYTKYKETQKAYYFAKLRGYQE